jgi:ribosomal protein S18 acetylase RimI-like enzyme
MVEIRWLETGAGGICAELLALVPAWFGLTDANESYRDKAEQNPTAVAYDGGHNPVGLLSLVQHSRHAAEIYVMAVRPELHRSGIGRRLVQEAEHRLRGTGTEYLQVKTLSAAAPSKEYSLTRAFYEALDFRVLEEIPRLWDESNPALILIKRL